MEKKVESAFINAFSVFEDHVKNHLDQALKQAGFDADRDISTITVNRWPHGYSYSNDLVGSQNGQTMKVNHG